MPWEEVILKKNALPATTQRPYICTRQKGAQSLWLRLRIPSHILFCNSEGVMYYDYRPMVTLGAVCIMEENGKVENGYAARAYHMGFEFLNDDVVELLAQEAVAKTSILFRQ